MPCKGRLIEKIGARWMPYEHITEETAFTPRQKKILELTNQIRKTDRLAEAYLRRFLRKRRHIITQIREMP